MQPTQTGGETTRLAIIAASYQLFSEQGYHGTSMRDIAARAGITAGSIYNHFSDKEQVMQAVILQYHPIMRILPRLSEVEGKSAEALIRDAAQRIVQDVEADPGVLNLVFVELIDLRGAHLPELIRAMYPQVQRFVEKVYASGQIALPRDPLVFFSAFVGMLVGYAFTHVFLDKAPEAPISDRSLERYIETFLWGVVSRQEGPLRSAEK